MSAPLVVNLVDGSVWERRTETRSGVALFAIAGAPKCCPPSVMATYAELVEHGIAGTADVLPMPVGPRMPDFPPPPRTEVEKLHAERARLQCLLAEAVRDTHLARRERDLMRERVSEPFGCQHCGEAKRSHGRRYVISAGVHSWERPTDEQVKARMLARRVARSPFPATPELDQVLEELTGVNLSLYEEELESARLRLALASAQRGRRELRARVAELESERHSTNEALADVTEALRAAQASPAGQKPDPRGCQACGSLPETWCPDCAACEKGCFGGFDGNSCTHARAPWGGPSVEAPADGITRRIASVQALREDEPVEDVSRQVARLRALLAGQREAGA